jgi:hypothetical protein
MPPLAAVRALGWRLGRPWVLNLPRQRRNRRPRGEPDPLDALAAGLTPRRSSVFEWLRNALRIKHLDRMPVRKNVGNLSRIIRHG